MTVQTPSNFRSRFRNFTLFLEGVRQCAAAVDAGKRPSRAAMRAAGLEGDMFAGRNY